MKKKRVKRTDTKAYQAKQFRRLSNKAMNLWKQVVHKQWGDKCQACGVNNGSLVNGKPVRLNCHHIEDKGNWALRFDPKNGILLCPLHHKFGIDSVHKSPVWFFMHPRAQPDAHTLFHIHQCREGVLPQRRAAWTVELLSDTIKDLEKCLKH